MIENWHSHFVPECFFDTMLFKKILNTNRRLMHTKGCNNVVNRFRVIKGKKGSLYDSSFGVGMVDRDKRELSYLKECELVIDHKNLLLWKFPERHHYIIQLDPPLEEWVSIVLKSDNKKASDFGYPIDYKKLKNALKDDIDKENDGKLNELLVAILTSSNPVIEQLKKILLHFRDNTYQSDINELKNA